MPATNGGTDTAAASIGQGRVEVSPVVARGDGGQRRAGHLRAAGALVKSAGGARTRPAALDGTAVAQLRSMMASVVSSGTGTVLREHPGGPVRGKTGTAEHGSDPDALPRTWFAGYQRDVAFAVLVEEGKSGGTVAAPVAKKFLTNLPATEAPTGSGRPRPANRTGPSAKDSGDPGQMGRTWSACGPLGPWVTSNSTRWASSRDR